jgi:hypothetical protein
MRGKSKKRKNEYKSTKMSGIKHRHKPVRQNPKSGDLIQKAGSAN